MTIKEAFEALSSACAKGMKNPFFVMRRLKESFDDVADKVVDGGGSVVSVTAELTKGTKIATVTVDGEDTDLYAPEASSGINYSETEQDTGLKWIDGRTIYQKTIDLGVFGNVMGQVVNKEHNISNLDILISVMCTGSKNDSRITIPTTNANSYLANMNIAFTNTNVVVMSSAGMKDYHGYVTLTYTKSV